MLVNDHKVAFESIIDDDITPTQAIFDACRKNLLKEQERQHMVAAKLEGLRAKFRMRKEELDEPPKKDLPKSEGSAERHMRAFIKLEERGSLLMEAIGNKYEQLKQSQSQEQRGSDFGFSGPPIAQGLYPCGERYQLPPSPRSDASPRFHACSSAAADGLAVPPSPSPGDQSGRSTVTCFDQYDDGPLTVLALEQLECQYGPAPPLKHYDLKSRPPPPTEPGPSGCGCDHNSDGHHDLAGGHRRSVSTSASSRGSSSGHRNNGGHRSRSGSSRTPVTPIFSEHHPQVAVREQYLPTSPPPAPVPSVPDVWPRAYPDATCGTADVDANDGALLAADTHQFIYGIGQLNNQYKDGGITQRRYERQWKHLYQRYEVHTDQQLTGNAAVVVPQAVLPSAAPWCATPEHPPVKAGDARARFALNQANCAIGGANKVQHRSTPPTDPAAAPRRTPPSPSRQHRRRVNPASPPRRNPAAVEQPKQTSRPSISPVPFPGRAKTPCADPPPTPPSPVVSYPSPTPTDGLKYLRAEKMVFSGGQWIKSGASVYIERRPFQHGNMRSAYRMKDREFPMMNFVAKRYKDTSEPECTYLEDVQMQAVAKEMAEAYNKYNPPKKVEFLDAFLVRLLDVPPACQAASVTNLFSVERHISGEYKKYTNNCGFVSEDDRNTPQAFSHFSYCWSKGKLLVCDIQGVADKYTDPQIHSDDGEGFGRGNLGQEGMREFFKTHACNNICEYMGLPIGWKKKKCDNGTLAVPRGGPRRPTPGPAAAAERPASSGEQARQPLQPNPVIPPNPQPPISDAAQKQKRGGVYDVSCNPETPPKRAESPGPDMLQVTNAFLFAYPAVQHHPAHPLRVPTGGGWIH